MKKLIVLLISFLLVGCVDTKVIEVKHTDNGYTSELLGIIEKNKNDYVYVSTVGKDNFQITRHNFDETYQQYKIDFDKKNIEEIEYIQNEENTLALIYENNDYKILVDHEQYFDSEIDKVIYSKIYYYQKDEQTNVLYKVTSTSVDLDSNTRTINHPTKDELLFFIEDYDKEILSINEISEGKLNEIDSLPLYVEDYEYIYSYVFENEYVHHYESDDKIRLLINEEELFFDKNIEDGYTLFKFDYGNEVSLKYENEESILLIEGENEEVINKNVEGYTLIEHYFYDNPILIYEKDNYKRIVIDGNTYDLGYNPTYHIEDDFILSTYKEEDYQSIYIDRKTGEVYLLSEYINMIDFSEGFGNYFIKNYHNTENPYSILKINNNDFTIIDLPFSWQFDRVTCLDENRIVYTLETAEEVSYYLVTLTE